MDIASLFPVARDLPIHDGNGNPTGIVFKVVGQDSKLFREITKRHLRVVHENPKQDVDYFMTLSTALVAACIVDWTGMTESGVELPFSQAKAIELLDSPGALFIREQVEAYTSQRANFFRKDDDAA